MVPERVTLHGGEWLERSLLLVCIVPRCSSCASKKLGLMQKLGLINWLLSNLAASERSKMNRVSASPSKSLFIGFYVVPNRVFSWCLIHRTYI